MSCFLCAGCGGNPLKRSTCTAHGIADLVLEQTLQHSAAKEVPRTTGGVRARGAQRLYEGEPPDGGQQGHRARAGQGHLTRSRRETANYANGEGASPCLTAPRGFPATFLGRLWRDSRLTIQRLAAWQLQNSTSLRSAPFFAEWSRSFPETCGRSAPAPGPLPPTHFRTGQRRSVHPEALQRSEQAPRAAIENGGSQRSLGAGRGGQLGSGLLRACWQ